jgi:hypothetical protein
LITSKTGNEIRPNIDTWKITKIDDEGFEYTIQPHIIKRLINGEKCRECGKVLSNQNKIGLCRVHSAIRTYKIRMEKNKNGKK